MNLYEKILKKQEKISLVGLGYVGLPIAIAFAKHANVIGYDNNPNKVELLKSGIDPTNEVGDETVKTTPVEFTSDPAKLKNAKFHIVAVPTPVDRNHIPDLTILKAATKTVAENLTKGSYVVFESTVYPGATEDECIPILEQVSGLKLNEDFKVGFSPERINPGDKVNRLETIVKIVSGSDEEALDVITNVYEIVVQAGVHKAKSIKVAEAAKVIENAQRDINIAFMNELSMIFNKLGIDTYEVLEAAGTKWNFLKFTPGLVGGHCIGVDPYYLTYKAESAGYYPGIILEGRKLNDSMGKYVADNIIKLMIKSNVPINKAKIGIFGFTFKENVPDIRNTRVIEIYRELNDFGIETLIYDPVSDKNEVKNEYDINLNRLEEMKNLDVIIFTVSHSVFKNYSNDFIESIFKNKSNQCKIIADIKNIVDKEYFIDKGYTLFRL